MDQAKIKGLIGELRHEIKDIHPITDDDIRLLLEIENDIDQLIKSSQDPNYETNFHNFSFTEAAVHFEQSHPKVAAVLSSITQSLANLGI